MALREICLHWVHLARWLPPCVLRCAQKWHARSQWHWCLSWVAARSYITFGHDSADNLVVLHNQNHMVRDFWHKCLGYSIQKAGHFSKCHFVCWHDCLHGNRGPNQGRVPHWGPWAKVSFSARGCKSHSRGSLCSRHGGAYSVRPCHFLSIGHVRSVRRPRWWEA